MDLDPEVQAQPHAMIDVTEEPPRPSLEELVARARNSSATDPTWRTDYRQ